ncbi:MAG: 2-amino-4-hydroxy-6-hydroxymethyldihydropteridine diphosphokinase [Ignavibacteria bacterium]
MVKAYVSFGSNIGDREANIRRAIGFLKQRTNLIKTSSIYETKPMYFENQEQFLNCVTEIDTELKPIELLGFLKNVEKQMGRKEAERNGPRIIDIDILFYGNHIINENTLAIPHPKIQERAFVLVPFAEIEPNFFHPKLKKNISRLLSELKYDKSEVKLKSRLRD